MPRARTRFHPLQPSALAFILVSIASVASSQTLVVNGGFDRNVLAWQPISRGHGAVSGRIAWSPLDAAGSPRSGSIELSTVEASGTRSYAVGQCVALPEPAEYVVFGGRLRVPSRQPAGSAVMSVDTFAARDCTTPVSSSSNYERLSNADYWSRQVEYASSRGVGSVRVVLSILKIERRFGPGDESDELKQVDGIPFRAEFDDVFIVPAAEKDLPRITRERGAGSNAEGASDPAASRDWGGLAVKPPSLSAAWIPERKAPANSAVTTLESSDPLRILVRLELPYSHEDVRHYDVQSPVVAARNNEENWGRRASLSVRLYRAGDRSAPVPLGVDDAGGGLVDRVHVRSIDLAVVEHDAFRTRVLRAWYECMASSLPVEKRPVEPPSDEQLFRGMFADYIPAIPPGDYDLVVRYLGLETGFWHEPLETELHFRVVEKPFVCGQDRHVD